MKKVYLIILSCFIMTLVSCEPKQDIIYAGIPDSEQHINKSMLDYMKEDNLNWEQTVKAIELAGLEDLFAGRGEYSNTQITFLGIKSWSFMLMVSKTELDKVDGESVFCKTLEDYIIAMGKLGMNERLKEIILQHVIVGKKMKDDFEFKDPNFVINDPKQKGYTKLTTMDGNELWAYRSKTPYMGVPDIGPTVMGIYSPNSNIAIPLATPDIKVKNGVVHALNYAYLLQYIYH